METKHLLLVHDPDNAAEIYARLESRRPWSRIAPGEILRVRGTRLRVDGYAHAAEGLHVYTSRDNVVAMPPSSGSSIADFYRYHAFVERFGCDPDAWLAHLQTRGRGNSGDARLARWVRVRMRRDPHFVDAIRRFVAATPMAGDDHLKKRTS